MRLETRPRAAPSYSNGFVRRYPRALFSVPLTAHHLMRGGVRASHGISLDIGEGGVGALVQGSLSVGETVAIDVALPGRVLSAVAIVRYNTSVSSGFEFVGLTPEERSRLAGIVAHA